MNSGHDRDRLLIRNVVEWVAEKYVEDDRLGPDVFATLLHECEEDGLVKTFYEKMIELADKGETYLADVKGYDGEIPLILIQGGKSEE